MEQLELKLVGAREPGFSYVIIRLIQRSWYALVKRHYDGSIHLDGEHCYFCDENGPVGFGSSAIKSSSREYQTLNQEDIVGVIDDEVLAKEWIAKHTLTWYGFNNKTTYDRWEKDPEAKVTYTRTYTIKKVKRLKE